MPFSKKETNFSQFFRQYLWTSHFAIAPFKSYSILSTSFLGLRNFLYASCLSLIIFSILSQFLSPFYLSHFFFVPKLSNAVFLIIFVMFIHSVSTSSLISVTVCNSSNFFLYNHFMLETFRRLTLYDNLLLVFVSLYKWGVEKAPQWGTS